MCPVPGWSRVEESGKERHSTHKSNGACLQASPVPGVQSTLSMTDNELGIDMDGWMDGWINRGSSPRFHTAACDHCHWFSRRHFITDSSPLFSLSYSYTT